MAENVGHLAVVESATDGVAFTEIDGANMASRDASREVIDVTPFKDSSAHKIKIMGIKDGTAQLGGHIVFATGTLSLDTGIKNLVQRQRDGGEITLRTKLDGAGGTYRGAAGVMTEFGLSADVSGAVEWTASVQLTASWA